MITGSPSLRVLDASGNDIGDDGIYLCLQNINTLTSLKVEQCGLSVEGMSIVLLIAIYSYTTSYDGIVT